MEDIEQKIYSLDIDDLRYQLYQYLYGRLHYSVNWEDIISAMAEKGYWCRISSPFAPNFKPEDKWGKSWFAGFTPHNCTGWNGKPDNQISGETGIIAVMRAALLTLMREEEE